MNRIFWTVAVVSAVSAVLATIPFVVLISLFYSGFLLAPVWLLAANLWWIMALLAPVVWFRTRGNLWIGVAVSLVLTSAGLVRFFDLRHAALAGIEMPFVTTPNALAEVTAGPMVVEFLANSDGVLDEAACDALCERLLTGDVVTTVRKITTGDPTFTRVFQRSDPEECLALDPDFPTGAPCILMVANAGQPADLRITVDGEGDGYASRDEVGGLVYLVSSRRLRVTVLQDGTETLLHDQSQRIWFEAVAPVPLFPNVGFDGNGMHGGGLAPLRDRKSDPPLDAAAILAGLGLPMGPGRAFVETEPARMARGGVYYSAKGYHEPAPYDLALIASVLDHTKFLDESISTMIRQWLERLEADATNAPTLRKLIARLPAFLDRQTIMLQRLIQKRPELFVDRFSDFYQQIQSGDEEVSRLAASTILARVRSDPFGTHDSDADAYVAALKTRRQWDYLIQVVGRYGFDPTPILQDELDKQRFRSVDPQLSTVFNAACRSDPKWADTLGPFVHQALLPLVDDIVDHDDDFKAGSTALLVLGRADLVQDLFDRVDWDRVLVRRVEEGMNAPSLRIVQGWYFRESADANDC